jgi:hypothetical protein
MYLFTRAGTFRPGPVREATAFVGAITDKVRQETGKDVHAYLATMFVADGTGAFGGCRWISGHLDIHSVEQAEGALMADPSWVALIDRIGTAFENDASQSIYRRLL